MRPPYMPTMGVRDLTRPEDLTEEDKATEVFGRDENGNPNWHRDKHGQIVGDEKGIGSPGNKSPSEMKALVAAISRAKTLGKSESYIAALEAKLAMRAEQNGMSVDQLEL